MGRPPSDRRSRVLSAASDLFSMLSFHDVKLDQVAERAGVAKGTIYLYFKNKEELFFECLVHGNDEFLKETERVVFSEKYSSEYCLRKLVEQQAEIYAKKGPLILQLINLGHTLPLSPEMFGRLLQGRRQLVELFALFFHRGMERGDFFKNLSPKQMAIIFTQIFELNFKFHLFEEPLLSVDDVNAILLKLFKPK